MYLILMMVKKVVELADSCLDMKICPWTSAGFACYKFRYNQSGRKGLA